MSVSILAREDPVSSTLLEQIIREHSKTFYFATALLPSRKRYAIRALYAFCRASDDLVDREQTTLSDLDAWREQVNLPAHEQSNPVLKAWSEVREEYAINRLYEKELLDGIEMDLNFQVYPTFEALKVYCYRVASTVGLLAIPIIGLAKGVSFEQAAPFAIQLGIALQMTNILRDIGEDARRNRVYLPLEDLQKFNLTHQDILNGVYDDRFIRLMKFEISRTRELYQQAIPGIAFLSKAARPAVGAAAFLYRAILDEIENIQYHVHTLRAHTKGWKKIAMLPSILWKLQGLPQPGEVL
ncbi:phytoene/squalene synthase family protein [Anaerolinea thermophila]|uniref:Phytoene synthase n=1 Tax=Anaerolinea thermophila (strain DSM 14523 / JCM 11388 / NBRC 100420 / UNI-1) TaxID=926569 RepID=E8N4L4_ANATU|nr:phytoene/squalene synthase family protein [Anaerolinea thermophila]BAJ63378.1 phytoene synthase [Anaerolinea thermophila UNI-1]